MSTKPWTQTPGPEANDLQCPLKVGGWPGSHPRDSEVFPRAARVLTSLSWSRELLLLELVASRKLSPSLLWSPPLDTATFIWRQGEMRDGLSTRTLQGGVGAQPGSGSSLTPPGPSGLKPGEGGGRAEPTTDNPESTAHSYPEWKEEPREQRVSAQWHKLLSALSFPLAGGRLKTPGWGAGWWVAPAFSTLPGAHDHVSRQACL